MSRRTKRTIHPLVGGFFVILAILLLCAAQCDDGLHKLICTAEQSRSWEGDCQPEVTAQVTRILHSGLVRVLQLDGAEVSITDLICGREILSRMLLPDGWVEAWLRTTGQVKAGVPLDDLSPEDLTIQHRGDGSLHAVLRLPAPVITHRELNQSEWGYGSNFWVWSPGRIALGLREQLHEEVYSSLDSIAAGIGLLEEARTAAAVTASRFISSLGIGSCEVILDNHRSISFGDRMGGVHGI